eukprot:scaffold126515_cov45-Phaeocystis_antarctica.AAC.1
MNTRSLTPVARFYPPATREQAGCPRRRRAARQHCWAQRGQRGQRWCRHAHPHPRPAHRPPKQR